ncbi:class I SAM-dependent methyltransferase [Streptomyces sp. PSKA54]|uniref:Class I SAM-dependent methyltransferase n=2 Tax=Streptomyces TaxID=1883 RepID=A0A7W2D2R5_9ACTN|nr:class I SAM-dependent methyltransferase [Streptomyces himalayensis subsp. aureolus]
MMALPRSKRATAYKGTSPEAIRHHYDFLGDFYKLFLGPELVYSYGMWEPGDTLESAQLRKLDYHIEAARAQGAERVLDVGCGWGSLLYRLVDTHQVQHAVGITMSPGQAAWIRNQDWPHCDVRVENWFDHTPDAPYDAIIAIEAIEHFAGSAMLRSQRIARYRLFFERCHSWLKPGGRLSVQTNAWGDRGWLASILLPAHERTSADSNGGPPKHLSPKGVYQNVHDTVTNIREGLHASRTVFPETFLPSLSELTTAARPLFTVQRVRHDPEDGVLTLESWLERAQANQARGAELIGEKAVTDIIREQRIGLKFLREQRYTVLRMVFQKS